MKHKDYKELLHLSFYDELSDEDRQVLDDHLPGCSECRRELEELQRLGSLLSRGERIDVTDELLNEARRELRVALRLQRSRRPFWAGILEQWSALTSPSARVAFGSIALIVVGLATGYLLFKPSESAGISGITQAVGRTDLRSTEPRVTNFRFAQQPLSGNEVEFTFDMVTPVHMKGDINDNAVQRVMAQALMNDDNPGVRLRTVNAIANQAEGAAIPDEEIKSALLQAVKSDRNVGVRKEALKAMQRFPLDNEIKTALIFVLKNEENPSIRMEVISYLQSPELSRKLVDQELLDVLKDKMQSDNNNYVRSRAKNFYEEVRQQ